ncbi:MAG: protoporphyrinogen oxidase, partial [Lysobacteraceae bacterium]
MRRLPVRSHLRRLQGARVRAHRKRARERSALPVHAVAANAGVGVAVLKALVVGGGITGLTAAYVLARAGAGVVLAEGSSRLGGKVRTEVADGFLIEHGPDAFLTVRPAALELCREIGLGPEVVAPRGPESVLVWHRDRLLPVPPGAGMGMPTRFVPFLRSPLFTPLQKVRAGIEVVVPSVGADGDLSIGAFLRRRYGNAVVDRVAGPLISAIYGADADELSLDALMPRLREAERRHGSLVRAGMAARRSARAPAAPMLMTLRNGLGSMVEALAQRLGPTEVRLDARLDRLERGGARYVARFSGGAPVTADVVILATPASVTAAALGDLAPAAVEPLRSITYRSTLSVTLAYGAEDVADPAALGFVVPRGALPITACTWSSAKWP